MPPLGPLDVDAGANLAAYFLSSLATRSDSGSISKYIARNAALWIRRRASDGDAHSWNSLSKVAPTLRSCSAIQLLSSSVKLIRRSCAILTRLNALTCFPPFALAEIQSLPMK